MNRDKKSPAEELLVEAGLLSKRTASQRQILDCLGCLWSTAASGGESVQAYAFQIINCRGIGPGTVYPVLARLEAAGVVTSQFENTIPKGEGRPARRYYKPAESEVATRVQELLPAQPSCPLQSERPSVETLFEDSIMTIARIALNGRNRKTINHSSTTTYHIISGEGTMYVNDTAHELQPNVSITVPNDTPYYNEGNVEMVAISVPPFDPTSVEFLD